MSRTKPASTASVTGRLIELGLGLLIVVAAIAVTRVWVELKNARRADSFVLRRSVELTLAAARQYDLERDVDRVSLARWGRFLALPPGQPLSARPAHAFVDSFVLCFQDGVLDSAEASGLLQRLMQFRPEIE